MSARQYVCDVRDCARPATTIHVIPDVPDCRDVRLACAVHSFTHSGDAVVIEDQLDRTDAYWFDLSRWKSGEMVDHIGAKINGAQAVLKIQERLGE